MLFCFLKAVILVQQPFCLFQHYQNQSGSTVTTIIMDRIKTIIPKMTILENMNVPMEIECRILKRYAPHKDNNTTNQIEKFLALKISKSIKKPAMDMIQNKILPLFSSERPRAVTFCLENSLSVRSFFSSYVLSEAS